jgi:hypothetical protein
MVAYAYDQIDQARAALSAVSKETSFESLKTLCRNHRERHRLATAARWGKGHRVAEMMSLW